MTVRKSIEGNENLNQLRMERFEMQQKPERDFYETLIFVKKDRRADSLYIISERDSKKGMRVIFYDVERGLKGEYKCGR